MPSLQVNPGASIKKAKPVNPVEPALSRKLGQVGNRALYERLDEHGNPTQLSYRWYTVTRSRGRPVWSTLRYFKYRREAEAHLHE